MEGGAARPSPPLEGCGLFCDRAALPGQHSTRCIFLRVQSSRENRLESGNVHGAGRTGGSEQNPVE